MKLRHTAALALVGWYLMLPPQTSKSPLRFDPNASLKSWYRAGIYSTADQCESDKPTVNGRWLEALEFRHTSAAEVSDIQKYQAYERCVATDDPRLKQ